MISHIKYGANSNVLPMLSIFQTRITIEIDD
jgi:hypothetical protein